MTARKKRDPNLLRCYDNEGATFDRYTIIPNAHWRGWRGTDGSWTALGASSEPFSAAGFGQHCMAVPGAHLGKRVAFADLPEKVQWFAIHTFIEE